MANWFGSVDMACINDRTKCCSDDDDCCMIKERPLGEMVDASGLEPDLVRDGGSSPSEGTTQIYVKPSKKTSY